jgi:uncharacterized protein (TIGR02117 family)
MRTLGRRAFWCLAGLIVLFAAAVFATARTADPALWPPVPGAPTVEIFLVSHGYHSGLVLPRALVAEVAARRGDAALSDVARRFSAYPWIEVGWGEENFYRSVPDVGSLSLTLAVRALFLPGNASVMHVVGVTWPPRTTFPKSDIVSIALSRDGFERALARIGESFSRSGEGGLPEALGPGLYGPSQFFRAVGSFNLFSVCNHWTAGILAAAGLPVAPVLATLPSGLFLDLRWRAGLAPMPAAG